jgi:hypothetical protein
VACGMWDVAARSLAAPVPVPAPAPAPTPHTWTLNLHHASLHMQHVPCVMYLHTTTNRPSQAWRSHTSQRQLKHQARAKCHMQIQQQKLHQHKCRAMRNTTQASDIWPFRAGSCWRVNT